jgi:hypothetical protein
MLWKRRVALAGTALSVVVVAVAVPAMSRAMVAKPLSRAGEGVAW